MKTFTRYHTKTGSMYDVLKTEAGTLVRQAKAGGKYVEGRANGKWTPAQDAGPSGLGWDAPLFIYWGPGRDEHSPTDDGIPDEKRQRNTVTSPIVRVEIVEEA